MIIKRPGDEAICIAPDNILAATDNYNLYFGRGEHSADAVLCRVVQDKSLNGKMYVEQKHLKELAKLSCELEIERIERNGDDGHKIHYDWLFPVCNQSFSCPQLDGRRVNIFEVLDASWDDFIPFSKLRGSTKVDAKSAAWVLGRFLKLQTFLDESKSCCGLEFNPDMVLVDPKAHRVVYMGWFDDLVRSGSSANPKLNISRMINVIYDWIEKNETAGELEYLDWLKKNQDSFTSGLDAHVAYYEFLNELWGKGYHPFTFKKDGVWKNVKNYA